jgi:hypothetical protein
MKQPTCQDYRQEMMLLALRRRLHANNLEPAQREAIELEIRKLEAQMRME